MQLRLICSASLSTEAPAPAMFLIEAASTDKVTIKDSRVAFDPCVQSATFVDALGNPCRRLLMPGGEFSVEYAATVEVMNSPEHPRGDQDPDVLSLSPDVLPYTLPSRYCPSDRLARMATDMFGESRPGRARVEDIVRWINENISFQYGASNSSTCAVDTAVERVGVCRDFAHLAISFCRAVHIPARYVSGYCLDLEPQDLHAYLEAYVDGHWVAFDPTSATPRRALVPIAKGLDAVSCAWCTIYGTGITNRMAVDVVQLN